MCREFTPLRRRICQDHGADGGLFSDAAAAARFTAGGHTRDKFSGLHPVERDAAPGWSASGRCRPAGCKSRHRVLTREGSQLVLGQALLQIARPAEKEPH